MTRYFVGANIWFGLAMLLYLGSHRSHWTIPYYRLFGQGQYDSGAVHLTIFALFGMALWNFVNWRRSTASPLRETPQFRPSRSQKSDWLFRLIVTAAAIFFVLVVIVVARSDHHDPGPTFGMLALLMFLVLIATIVHLVRRGRDVHVANDRQQPMPLRPDAQPRSAPRSAPSYFKFCLLGLGVFFGIGAISDRNPGTMFTRGLLFVVFVSFIMAYIVYLISKFFFPSTQQPRIEESPHAAAQIAVRGAERVFSPPAVRIDERICPTCSMPIAADAPHGQCPRCLFAGAFKSVLNPAARPKAGPSVPPTPEEVQEFFPNLEIRGLIGHGGMGAVYEARQMNLDRVVALKIIRPRDDDPTFAERFVREAKAMAKLAHPNIVNIHESGEAGGSLYLLMEYVDGVTLREAIVEKAVRPMDAMRIVGQLCDALQYAHSQGVVHRDIKPENILLDRKGNVKVVDFGLAKLNGDGAISLTHTRQMMGTPHYMAPEQWEKPTEVDHRADIYALGVLIYELLTNELPIGRFDPPSVKARLDARIDEIVLRLLSKEPNLRYQQANDVRTAIDRLGELTTQNVVRGAKFYEYRSPTTVLGWPLLHYVSGIDPKTGKRAVARGVVAVGGNAIGVLAIGQFAWGFLTIAQFGVGVLTIAQFGIGLLAGIGQFMLGLGFAVGQFSAGFCSIGMFNIGYYAIGLIATGRHVISSATQERDPEFWNRIEPVINNLREAVGDGH